MNSLGPVSTQLEQQLRESVRKHGIVVWLDLDGHYTEFVDLLRSQLDAQAVPYRLHAYRGSFLELILAMEDAASGVEPVPMVVHVPGFNEELIKKTPLLELYKAGTRFRKALATLIREAAVGKLPTERIGAFLEQEDVTLAGADAWLDAGLETETGALAHSLRNLGLTALFDQFLLAKGVADQVRDPNALNIYLSHLRSATGIPATWQKDFAATDGSGPEELLYLASAWALCVEYVHDLKRAPVDARLAVALELPGQLVEECRDLCRHLRARHRSFYVGVSDDAAAWLVGEREQARAAELGSTDTFRFEEEVILDAALHGLARGEWKQVLDWAGVRTKRESFWLEQDVARMSAWQLIEACATLGAAVSAAGPSLEARDLEEAAQRYVAPGAAVDRAHRLLLQKRLALLYPQIPCFDRIRSQVDRIAEEWRRWADSWAVDFNRLCRSEGFLPEPELRQRTLFSQVVEPMLDGAGATALFLVDALRYEMADELFRLLDGTPDSHVRLNARFAELPTITSVGMNVLPPVEDNGRLRPVIADESITGFSSGELNVVDPKSRKRAIQSRVGGATLPWLPLEEVLQRSQTSLKQTVARAQLVLVSSLEIDEAGEKGAGPALFEHAIQRLRAAWRLLRDAGVRRFVMTADHGFLLLNSRNAKPLRHGRKVDPNRRYVLSSNAADHPGESRVALEALGYVGTELHLLVPETTCVFDRGKRGRGFVHGGNSLQERVIPVLTIEHRHAAGTDTTRFAITARRLDEVQGMHCIEAEVKVAAQDVLDFGGSKEVALALRVSGTNAVQLDLCQVRGAARLEGAVLHAQVGRKFEVFFRVTGGRQERVLVELVHPTAEVQVSPCTVDGRFAVSPGRGDPVKTEDAGAESASWLDRLGDDAVRRLFAHLDKQGVITEPEVVQFLGTARAARRFSRQVEVFALQAPFAVRIEVVAGIKRYVKDGARS